MKRNPLFAALLALAMTISLAVPALGADTADQRLAKVTLAVKGTLGIDDSYTEFYGDHSETSLGARWSLRWSDETRSLNVSATEEGKVLSLNYWDDQPSYYYTSSFRPKFPDMTVAQAKTYAQAFLDKVLTDGETAAFTGNERDYLSATSYTFGGTILLNDTDSPLTFRVRVRLSDGMVTYFSREDVSQYVGGVPAPTTVTTSAHAGELLAGTLNLYVEYVWDGEKQMAALRYLPGARDDYYVDAATGELINLTELRALLNRNYIKGDDMLFAPEAAMDAAMGAESNLQLSPAELEGVAKLEGVLTQEELGTIVRSYTALGLKDFELVGATFSVQKPDLIILEDGTTREEGETQVTARLTFARNTEEGIARRYVTMDGKTGELFSMSGYNPYADREPVITQEQAETAGIAFLTQLWPEQVHKTEVYRSYAASYAYGSHSFTLCQKENGYFYPANRLSVGVDAETGAVMSFSKGFDDDVTFESPEGMISMEEALAIWADSYPVVFGYQTVPVSLDLLGEEVMPLRNEGYTYYNSLRPGYVYGSRDGWYSGVNAIGGTLAGSEYVESEPMGYSDLEDHWAADILNQLALYEVGWQGGKASPDEALTQVAYLELLASSEGYHYSAENADPLYDYAIRRGFLTREEREDDKPVTRGEMMRMLLDCLGYKEFANLPGIFRCDYTDAHLIPRELMGYAALSQALGLINGGDTGAFGADSPALRCEAATVLWKYMSK